jgi:hypothetical protein
MANFFDRFDAPRRAPAAPASPQADARPSRAAPPAAPEREVTPQEADPRRSRGFGRAMEPEPVDTFVADVPFDPRALPRPGETAPQTRAPEAPPSPFAGEPITDTAARRGQQAAQGFTDVFASLPEAGAIAGEAVDLTQKRETAEEILNRQQTIDDIRARLKEPGLNERTRALLKRNLADLEKGQEELTRRTEAPVAPAPERPGFATAARIRSWTEDTFGKPDPRDTTFWATLAQGGGNMAGFVATALAGAPLGPGGALAATGVAGSALNSAQIYKEATAAGASQEEALAAARLGGLLGATEAIPVTRALMILPPRLRGEVSNQLVRRLVSIGQSSGEEAMQEAIQGIGNNLIAQGYYDPERGTFEDVPEQMLVGAILGGAVNVGGQGFDVAFSAGTGAPPDAPQAPTEDEPPERPAGEREIRRPDLLTPQDIASPLPDDAIAAGKEILEAVEQGRPLPPPPPPAQNAQNVQNEPATDDPDVEILPVTDADGTETGEFVRFNARTGEFTPVPAPAAQETAPRDQAPAPVSPLPAAPAPQGFGVAMDGEPPVTPEELKAAEEAQRVPRPTERKPENLMTFIVRQGGIWSGDAMIGDVRQLDYRRPGLVKTQRMARSTAGDNNGGLTLDEVRERAEEEGFLPPGSTVADLLDLMDRDVRGERQVRQRDLETQQQWDAFEGRGQQDPEQVALEMRRRNQEDAANWKRDEPPPPLEALDFDLVPMDAPEPATRLDQARARVRAVLDRMGVGYGISANDAEDIARAHAEYGEDIELLLHNELRRAAANAADRDAAEAERRRAEEGRQAPDTPRTGQDGDADASRAGVDQDDRGAEVGSGAGTQTDRGDQESAPAEAEPQRSGTRDGGRVDVTPEGLQLVIPGAEQIPDRQRAERAMQQPRRGGNAPMQDDGLFGDPMNRRDLFDEISTAAAQADPNPTDAQKSAGNYRKGHVAWKGLDITIENAKGSERTGTDSDGETWSVTMPAHYGYIKRTEGADGDHVDVYLGDKPDSDLVFVVDQVDAETGAFDEHKVLLGFASLKQATATYDAAFSDGKGPQRRGAITGTSVDEFKRWLADGDTSRPWSPSVAQSNADQETPAAPNALTSQENAASATGSPPVVTATDQETAQGAGLPREPDGRTPASWVIREKATGEVVMETTDPAKVRALNTERFEAVPIQQYLAGLNRPTTQENVALPDVAGSAGTPAPAADATAPSVADEGGGSGDAAPRTDAVIPPLPQDLRWVRRRPGQETPRGMVSKWNRWWQSLPADVRQEMIAQAGYGGQVVPGADLTKIDSYKADAIIATAPWDGVETVPQDVPAPAPTAPTGTLSNLSQQEQDRAALLRARIAERMRNQTNAGVDPALIQDAVELASLYIKSGFRRFRDLLAQVAQDMGITEQQAEPWVRVAYNQVRDDLELSDGDVSDMDDARAVIAAARAVRAGETSDVPGSSPSMERGGAGQPAGDGDGAQALPAPAGSTERGARGGARGSGAGTGGRRGRAGIPEGGAAPVGAQGDLGLRGPERAEPGAAGGAVDRGSGADRLDGPPADRLGAEDAARSASDSTSLEAKLAQQRAAAGIPVIPGDRANIDATLPLLYPEQRGDVAKVEARFAKPDGHGILLTNGTGSGKTLSGLGVAYRFWHQGKRNILIVSESQPILAGWDRDAARLGLTVNRLASTQDAGSGIVSTTYANLGQNNELSKREWDLILLDEAHNLMQAKDGTETKPVSNFRGLAKHPYHLATLSEMRRADEWARARALPENTQARADAMNALYAKQRADVEKLRSEPRPKALFLSATPFAHDFTLDYAEGFLFRYGDNEVTDSGSRQGGREMFFVRNLGYRIRYHKLTQPEAAVDRGVFQRQLHDRLRQEGALAGRMLTVATDYDRRFNIVADRKGEQIDQAMKWWWDLEVSQTERNAKDQITKAIGKHFDYLKRMQLLEAIKARAIIPDVEAHLDMGRKVVIFHDYNVGGGTNPFGISVPDSDDARAMWSRFMAENPYVRDLNFAGYLAPKDALTQHFGARAAAYNGTISKGERLALRNRFQDDNSGLDVLVVQSDAGSAGIDLHDTTGAHQRVLINIGMPNRPTRILQAEGRIRRIGVVSDAIYRYPFTGTAWERDAFARRIAEQSGTVENFALGSDARRIRESFIDAFEAADTYPVGMEGEGKGGVEIDGQAASVSPYEEAKTHYFGTAQVRANRNRRAGVDWFATPQPLGFKMVEWAGVRPYESVLEPSAGDGAIARYFPANAERTLVDNSPELMSRARLFTGGARHVERDFESFNIVNKFDAVVMNPPFGFGGKTAMDHVRKAMKHVRPGGRIVALIPTGAAADKQFDAMMDSEEAKGFAFVADVALPRVTFERAGTGVPARVVIFDRAERDMPTRRINLTGADTINDFFDRLEGIGVPDRPAPTQDAADRILDEAVAQAEATPLSVSAPMVTSAPDSAYETFQFPHTRTGAMQFGVQIKERLGDRFAEVRAVAKGHGGDYSSFHKPDAGARRGFLFPSEAARQAFLDDLYKPVVSRDQRLTGPGPSAVFYSPLARALEGAKQASATPSDWKAIIAKLDGVKRAEVEWLGVEDWLDGQTGQVPREALVAFVQANEIVIEEEVGAEFNDWLDMEVEVGEPVEPDWDMLAENFTEDARAELGDDADDAEVRERAEEMAREGFDPTEFRARVYDRNGDWDAEGSYDSDSGEYTFGGESFASEADVREWADTQAQVGVGADFAAKFTDYTESGGDNYREILLRVPQLDTTGPNLSPAVAAQAEAKRRMDAITDRPNDQNAWMQLTEAQRAEYRAARAEFERLGAEAAAARKRPFVQSSHFEQPNIVVHARVKDRKDADGKKVLFVEEIQSDLASKWRESTEGPEITARRREIVSEERAAEQQLSELVPQAVEQIRETFFLRVRDQATDALIANELRVGIQAADVFEIPQGQMAPAQWEARAMLREFDGALSDQIAAQLKRLSDLYDERVRLGTDRSIAPSTPETPFLEENTYALMVKRLMRMAADEGYDAIAWTPGYMQAERWNKAAQSVVDGVEWASDGAGGAGISLTMSGGQLVTGDVSAEGIVTSRTDAINGKKLSALVGPGLAKQIMEEPQGSVSGQKIVFPDSGYAIAYDQQIKRSVEKIAKKHGAAVKIDRSLPDMRSGDMLPRPDLGRAPNPSVAGDWVADTRPVWRVDFTPSLREAATKPAAILQKPSLALSDTLMAQEMAAEVMPELRAMLDRVGLQRVRVGVNTDAGFQGRFTVNRLGHMDILIGRAVDPAQTLYHEAVHALRVMNVFTDKEWATLEARAIDDWIDRYDIARRYPDLTLPEQMEEAIAEAFGDFGAARRREENSLVLSAFAKIKRLLKAIRDVFRARGMETAADIFGRTYAGEIGARKAGNTGTMQVMAAQADQMPRLANTETAEFKRWFGDSKVVDAEGKPLVVYHGGAGGIDEFMVPFFATPDAEGADFFRAERHDETGQLYPVFLSIKNPFRVDGYEDAQRLASILQGVGIEVNLTNDPEFGWEWEVPAVMAANGYSGSNPFDVSYLPEARAALEAAGYDGMAGSDILLNDEIMAYVAFRPEQIKSVFNRGTFDPASPMIRDQRFRIPNPTTAGRMHHMNAMGMIPYIPDRRISDVFEAGNMGVMERLRTAKGAARDWIDRRRITIQDRMLPLLRAEEAVIAAGGTLTEDQRGYLAEETFSGKVGRHLFEIDEEYTKPIIDIIAETNDLTAEAVGQWLYARHALERNARIASINPQMPDGGSGMTDAEAQQILADAASGPHAAALDQIGTLIDKLRERTLSLRESKGLITPAEAQMWRTMYAHYVPLKGFADTDHSEATLDVTGLGRAYNVRGQESRRALGRASEAFNPLVAALTQAQEVAVRAEKNMVANAVLKMVEAHPSPMWKVVKPKQKRYFNRTTGMVETRVENPQQAILDPNMMAMKVNGEEVRIEFKDARLARALGQVGVDQIPAFLRPFQAFSRYFSAINTMLNPVFTIVNASRDVITASINLSGLAGDKAGAIRASALKNWPRAFAGALRGQKGKADTEWAKHFRAFDKAGGKVSFWQLVEPETGAQDLESRLWMKQSWTGAATRIVRPSTRDNPILEIVERFNLAVDNAIRLAAFVEARKQGFTEKEAASLSKNLTVNFNRRGTGTSFFNAFFPFFNAAIQGTQVLFRVASHKAVRRSMLAMFGLGLLSDLVNAALSEEDDDEELAYDKIPDWKHQRNIVLMTGQAGALEETTIPLPYGYNVFWYAGVQAGKVIRGVKDADDAAYGLLGASFSAFSPISAASPVEAITPTVVRPLWEIQRNEDWLGRPIMPVNPYADFGPDAYKFFPGASLWSRNVADVMNRATGGTQAEAGLIDVSPETLDHAFGFLTGGMGRFVGDVTNVTTKLAFGRVDEIESRDFPFYSTVQYETGDWLDRDRYYRFRDSVREAREAVDTAAEAGVPVSGSARMRASLENAMKEAEKSLRDKRAQVRRIEARSDLSAAEARRLRETIRAAELGTMMRFNRLYVETMGPQGE